ncbi:uncharacterized protein LOC134288193 [Aedes albopictus]|uniref:GIY-YIG domain-containing protein n=1 Tax=Aedes albopictus TaxID=7160 RepID=A0ABM1XTS0_AEDAL
MLNSQHNTIKFTVEKEVEGRLPFLDLLISRKEDSTLKFGIYRKPTSTDRYITSDSNHFGAQKQAAFHSMAHRLFNVPMAKEEFEEEKDRIYSAAEVNGYDKPFVDKIIRKHKRKTQRNSITTLQPDTKEVKRVSLPFYPKITNPIKTTLHRQGLHVVHKSENTLRDLLCNLKDKVPPDEQFGIYQIPCKDCPVVYIGQTRRKVKVRIREHKNAVVSKKSNESSVAAHTVETDHEIDWGIQPTSTRFLSRLTDTETVMLFRNRNPPAPCRTQQNKRDDPCPARSVNDDDDGYETTVRKK